MEENCWIFCQQQINRTQISTPCTFAALAVIVAARPHDESKAQWTGKPWLGKWESTDKGENLEPFIKAANIEPRYQGMYNGKLKTVLKYSNQGEDHYHAQFVFPGTDHKKGWDFKINQEGTYRFDGNEVKVLISLQRVCGFLLLFIDMTSLRPSFSQKKFRVGLSRTFRINWGFLQYKYTENGDQLDVYLNYPSRNTEITQTYKVNGDELEQVNNHNYL